MASVKQLGRKKNVFGEYRYRVRTRLPGSKNPISRTVWANSKADAEKMVLKEVARARDGQSLTWEDALPIWRDKAGFQYNETYSRDYELIVKQFTQNEYEVELTSGGKTATHAGWGKGAGLPITGTSVKDISDFMDWRRDQRFAAIKDRSNEENQSAGNAAANKARMILLALARTLRKEGILPARHFEFEMVPKRKYQSKKGHEYSHDLLADYMGALPEEAQLIIEWIVLTGWRSTAACKLTEHIIDEREMVVTQRHKGGRIRREPLDEHLVDLLRRARAFKSRKADEFEERESVYRIDASHLFVNSRGQPWNHTSLRHCCQRHWISAGLKTRKIHELRTTYGTEAGRHFPATMVQAALGHTQISSTEHYLDKDAMDIAEVGRVVRGTLVAALRGEQKAVEGEETVRLYSPELRGEVKMNREDALKLFEPKARVIAS